MPARAAAIAPAAAAALPPPGVAVGAASCSMKGSTPARRPPTADFAGHHGGEAVLKNERRIEILDLQEPLCSLFEGLFWNEADDLARNWNDAVAGRFALDEFEDAMDGGLLEVGEVHGDLGQAAHQESGAFDETQAAR